MKTFLLCVVAFLTTSCASVNIELKPNSEKSTSFIHSSHYGLWGLIGSDSIDLQQVCMGSEPVQVRNYFNFEDFLFAVSLPPILYVPALLAFPALLTFPAYFHFLFAISTLGLLYSPKSTEIWCEMPYQDNVIKL